MESRASARYLHGSAQKARLVIDMIRGKNVNKALAILQYTDKRAAGGIEKCVRSAIANASEAAEKANIAIDPDELWVKTCFVDRGPTKNRSRMRPAPQGRAYREKRHFCHVTVLLSNDETPAAAKAAGEKAGEKAAPKKTERPAASKSRKRGGAVAAPRAKRTAPKTESAAPKKQTRKTQTGEVKDSKTSEEKSTE
jgi:large subunit ribosomal protein L22